MMAEPATNTAIGLLTLAGSGVAGALGGVAMLATLDPNQVIITALTSLTTITVGFFGLRQHRLDKKTQQNEQNAALQGVKVDQGQRLIDQLQEQVTATMLAHGVDRLEFGREITELRQEQSMLSKRVLVLELGSHRLVAQIRSLGAEPVWHPDLTMGPIDPG